MNNIENMIGLLTNRNIVFESEYSNYLKSNTSVNSELKNYLDKAQASWNTWIKEIKFIIKSYAYALKVNYNDNCYKELVNTITKEMNKNGDDKNKAKEVQFDTNSYHNDIICETREKLIQFEKVVLGIEEEYQLPVLIDKFNDNIEINQSYFNDVWSHALKNTSNEIATCNNISSEELVKNIFNVESELGNDLRVNIRRYWNMTWLESTEYYGIVRQIDKNDRVYLDKNPSKVRKDLENEMKQYGISTEN